MGVELFILLVFASIAKGSYVPTLTVINYGLSDQQVSVLNQIITNQEAAASAYSRRIKTVFEILFDLKAKADEDCSEVSVALAGVEDAVRISFDSIEIVLGESCSVIEVFRNAAYGYVNDAVVHIAAAIELAQPGDYYENRDAIEVNRVKVEEDLTNVVEGFYDSISTCLSPTDAEVLAVIKDARDGSIQGVVNMTNAIFNAIGVRADAFTSGYEKRAFISKMHHFKNKALAGVRDIFEYKFSLLKTYFIYSNLNQPGILRELFSNQRALTASYRGYSKANMIAFDRIIEYLKRIYFEVSDDRSLDSSRNDLATRTAIAFFDFGDGANFVSIFALHPEATSAIAIAQKNVFNANAVSVTCYFGAIHVAAVEDADYSDATSYIIALRDAATAFVPIYVEEYLRVIRNNETFNAQDEAAFVIAQEIMIDGATHCINTVFDAAEILAKATYTHKVSANDFDAVEALLNVTNSGCNEFTQGVSAASFQALVANNVKDCSRTRLSL